MNQDTGRQLCSMLKRRCPEVRWDVELYHGAIDQSGQKLESDQLFVTGYLENGCYKRSLTHGFFELGIENVAIMVINEALGEFLGQLALR